MVERADEPLVFRPSWTLSWSARGKGDAVAERGKAARGEGTLVFWPVSQPMLVFLILATGLLCLVTLWMVAGMLWTVVRMSPGVWSVPSLLQGAPQTPGALVQRAIQLQPKLVVVFLFLAFCSLPLGVLVMRLWRATGSFYVYGDRLTRRRGRWEKTVYFSGAEGVRPGFWKVSLWQDKTRIEVPYHMPEFHGLHEALCERSAAYRGAFETRVPFEIQVERWLLALPLAAAGVVLAFMALVGRQLGLWQKMSAPETAAAVVLVGVMALLPFLVPRGYRFEEGAIVVRGPWGERQHEVSNLTRVSYGMRSLRCWFKRGYVGIPQPLVRYPLRELEQRLRRIYLERDQ